MTRYSCVQDHFHEAEVLWADVLSHIPFVKRFTTPDSRKEQKVRILSKNEVDEEDGVQLEQLIQNQEVILCHSSSMNFHQQCRGSVVDFEYIEKKVKVTVSSESDFPIWEDTDIWMQALSTPTSSLYAIDANTSVNSELIEDESVVQEQKEQISVNIQDQSDLFRSINGWKLISTRRERHRRMYDGIWKNVYLTQLEMTCIDPIDTEKLLHVQERAPLRLSDDIEEFGDVLVDVIKKKTDTKNNVFTITLGLTGFARFHAEIQLSKESTYYLNFDDGYEDDLASLASEEDILSGYQTIQNVDELCDKIGELTVTDVCIKTWFDILHNYAYIRLIVTSAKRKLQHFKLLTGHHVIIQSATSDRDTVLAVVSRVMKDGIVLTLQGVKKQTKNFVFSKNELFTIQIDHNYEDRLQKLTGKEEEHENLRRELINSDSDIRLHRSWKSNGKQYATFTSKNDAFKKIPFNTKFLLGKCWEAEGVLEKKADFIFAIRVADKNFSTPSTCFQMTFEIKFTRNLVRNSKDFELSKAFYYVDFDLAHFVESDHCYSLLNAKSVNGKPDETVVKSCPIDEDLVFSVFPFQCGRRAEERRRGYQESQREVQSSTKKPDVKVEKNVKLEAPEKQNKRKDTALNPKEKYCAQKLEKQLNDQTKTPKQKPKQETSAGIKRESTQRPCVIPRTFETSNSKDASNKVPLQSVSEPKILLQDTNSRCAQPRKAVSHEGLKSHQQENVLKHLDNKHKFLCFVNIAKRIENDNGNPLVELSIGFDENGGKVQQSPWPLGIRMLLTDGLEKTEVKIQGDVQDTNGETVTFMIQQQLSDLDFLNSYKPKKLLACFREHGHNLK